MYITKKEQSDLTHYEIYINSCNNTIDTYKKEIDLLENKIKQYKLKTDKILSKCRIRRIKKCNHEFNEYSWTTYYGSCGNDWCTYNDYHKHKSCSKCEYIVDEPLK